MAVNYAAKRKAPTPLEWQRKQNKSLKTWEQDLPSRSRLYMDQEDFGPTQPTRTSKRSQDNGRDKGHKQLKQLSEKERQATYGHRKPKGSVGKILVEKSLMEKGKSKPGSGERREKELKVAEPKDFDQVLRSFSDKSLEDLMSEGRFDDLRAVCSAVASFCPIPHMHLLQTLSKIPQGKNTFDAESCLDTMIWAVEWSNRESLRNFRRLLYPIVDTFLEDAILRRMKDIPLMNESFTNLTFTKGDYNGELKLTEALVWSGEGRPLDESDTVWLSRMEWNSESGFMPLCECSVVSTSPLVLKYTAKQKEQPVILAALAGIPCRIDKMATRTTFSRTLSALHCMMEPPRRVKNKKSQKEGVPDRLPMNCAPSETLKRLLMCEGTGKQMRLWASEYVRIMPEFDGSVRAHLPTRRLNRSQQEALAQASANALTLIQGPPGTGKTTTCVQILRYWAKAFKPPNKNTRILATSGSNIAVDNLVEGLVKEGIKVVRIGRPESARPELWNSCVENVAAKLLGVNSLADVSSHERSKALHRAVQEAQVVCCTAISAGSSILKETSFPLVLIDEASQATETATLVPICHGCKQLVLCGDHCQLPPTVKSESPYSAGLKMSLFERLALYGLRPIMLNTQYRMHPLLSAFPSEQFYDGQLSDDKTKTPATKAKAWVFKEPLVVAPVFTAETPKGTSHMNEGEAQTLVSHALRYLRNGGKEESLGIISPYDSQVKLLRRMLQKQGVRTGLHGVEVNSVDGFQGREKEVMISTVRSNVENATGFVRDWRRINVAITRAKSGLLVVCNPQTLARDHVSWLPWLYWSRWRGLWLNDEDVKLPELRIDSKRKACGLSSLPTEPPSPSRSRSPLPKWKRW